MTPEGGSSPSVTPLYKTDLAQTPLPEILVKIHRYRAPGRVECRRDDEVKRIYLDQGQIVQSTSNKWRAQEPVEAIVESIFGWADGTVTFTPGHDKRIRPQVR